MHDAQALRMFEESVNGPMVAVFSPGARLMVLKPRTNDQDPGLLFDHDSVLDFGTGGMALAAAPRPGSTTKVDLYVGSISFFAANTNFTSSGPAWAADDSHSAIASVEWDGSSTSLTVTSQELLDGLTDPVNAPLVYGVCGIAVGDLVPGNQTEEIVVTSLDGHLLVYERLPDGRIGQLLHHEQVEGALGAYNSIVIADLDAGTAGNELYVAGSYGLRKWIHQ